MSDRELISVFWATCAAIVVIWGIASMVRLGVDQQERAERREILDQLTREANEDLDAYRSITAPQKADSPLEQPTQQGNRLNRGRGDGNLLGATPWQQ